MTIPVRCLTCHRAETWAHDAAVGVTRPGGDRRPSVHPTLAAWRVLLRARRGEIGAVVGRCEACGQPLVAEQPGLQALLGWTLCTPDGDLVVGRTLEGPRGPLRDDEADRWMEAQFKTRSRIRPAMFLFQALLFSVLVVPMGCWLWALFYTFVYIFGSLGTL
jgi:hypothetical protein